MRGLDPRIHVASPLELLGKTLAVTRPGMKHMKPPLPHILSAVPRTLHVQLEIAKAIRTLTLQDEDERLSSRDGKPSLAKAAADDPEHPGWPAGTPRRQGRSASTKGQRGKCIRSANRNTERRAGDNYNCAKIKSGRKA